MALETTARSGARDRPQAGPSDGFISYSREESTDLAIALQGALERFAKPWYRLRAVRVFRDDASMSANADLRGTIEAALGRSGCFILLASPKAARSPWVASEVQWWLDHRTPERILLVRAAGAIDWDPDRGGFDEAHSTAIPPVLYDAYPREPRWIDLAWYGEPGSLGKRDPRFVERVADLAAPLHGRDRADLVGDNVRQHRRAVRLARGGVAILAVLLVVSLVATLLAVQQRREADAQRDSAIRQSVISSARQLAATALNLTDSDMQQASLLAVHAHRLHADAQTASALFEVAAASPRLVGFLDAGSTVTATAGTADARFVVGGTRNGEVWLWDRVTGERTSVGALGQPVARVLVNDDASVVAASAATNDADRDAPVDAFVWAGGGITKASHEILALSPSGSRRVEATPLDEFGGATVSVVSDTEGTLVDLAAEFSYEYGMVRFPDEDRVVLVSGAGVSDVFEVPSGVRLVHGQAPSGAHTAAEAVDPTGRFVAVGNSAKSIGVYPVEDTPPGEYASAAVGSAPTDTPAPISTAISPDGERVATSVDGRIWVGEVVPGAVELGATISLPAPAVLPGSGPTLARTLAFLGRDVLVSASGTAVSVWDLDQASRLGPLVHAPYTSYCNACGPGMVLVDRPAGRAWVANEGASSVVLADFEAGSVEYSTFGEGTMGRFLGKQGGWLDDERFVTWDDPEATVTVWTGPKLDRVANRWTVPDQRRDPLDAPDHILLTVSSPDRVQVVDSSGRVLALDLAGRHADVLDVRLPLDSVDEVGVDPSGDRVWTLTFPDEEFPPTSTQVTVIETSTGEVLLDDRLDGYFSHADLVGDTLRLANHDRPVTVLDLATGERTTLPLQLRLGSSWARTRPFVAYERNGIVSVYDTDLDSVVGSFSVPTAAYSWTELGFASGDRALVVATSAPDETGTASFRLVKLGYDEWRDIACATAGRDLTAGEWASWIELAAPDDLSCAAP